MNIDKLKNEITSRYEQISSLSRLINDQLTKCPEGRIRILAKNNMSFYYHVKDRHDINGKLISNSDITLISLLIQKSYLEKLQKTSDNELKNLSAALKHLSYDPVESVYDSFSPSRKAYIDPLIHTDDQFRDAWLNRSFLPKGFEEGTPYYLTDKGERVRSKSEQIIANRLYAADIPYIYEYPLMIDNMTIHPDFTILRMSDRKTLYYEHLGKMDDPNYSRKAVVRINRYILNGVQPGNNLFLSFETSNQPLDVRILDKMIEKFFK